MRKLYFTKVYPPCDTVMYQIISVVSYVLSNLKAFYEVVKVCIYFLYKNKNNNNNNNLCCDGLFISCI